MLSTTPHEKYLASTLVQDVLVWKVQGLFCIEINTPEGRGGKREAVQQNPQNLSYQNILHRCNAYSAVRIRFRLHYHVNHFRLIALTCRISPSAVRTATHFKFRRRVMGLFLALLVLTKLAACFKDSSDNVPPGVWQPNHFTSFISFVLRILVSLFNSKFQHYHQSTHSKIDSKSKLIWSVTILR